jgi:hypothetical protein
MLKIYQQAIPAAICLLVTLSTPVRAQTNAPHDSLLPPLESQPVVKAAMINAINQRSAAMGKALPVTDTIPFSRLGLSGLQPSARQQFTQYLNAGNTNAGIAKMHTMFNGMQDSIKSQQYINNKLRGFYALKDQAVPGSLRLPAMPENKLKGISWQTSYGDTTGMMSGWWNEGTLQDQVTIGGIPVQINYSTLSGYNYAGPNLQQAQFAKFSFDKTAYMQMLNQQMQQKYDLNKYFLQDLDIRSSLKSFGGKQLAGLQHEQDSLLHGGSSMMNKISPDQLMYLDSTQLRNAMLKPGFDPGKISADSLATLKNSKDSTSKALYAQYSYYNKVMALKQQMGGVKEMNQLFGAQNKVSGNIQGLMQQPGNTANMSGELLQMSPLQSLFANMKDLNVGSIGPSASKSSMSDLFMSGAAGSFLKGNKFMMLAAGKSNELGVQDAGLQSATGNTSYSMQFLQLGHGDVGSAAQSHVSMLNANAKGQNAFGSTGFSNGSSISSAISRNVFVGGLEENYSLGDLGSIDVEVSKSSSQFGTSQDAASVSKAAVGHIMDDIWATASVGLAYTGDVKKIGLSQKVYFNYSGLGYTNPGAPFASRGVLGYGFMVKRSWLKNRASVSLRTDIRNMAVSPLTDDRHKSIQYAVDARYRFTRKFTLSMNVLNNSLKDITATDRYTAFLNRKISFMSQSNGAIGGLPFSNNTTLGLQQLRYLDTIAPINSLFVTAATMHTFMAGPGMVVTDISYSHDLKDAAIYNNLFNADAGYQYTLWQKFSCSSSLIYMDSKDVVEQIGIRQQLATQLAKRWSLSVSADVRKDIQNSAANYYYGKFNTAMSLHYLIN